MGIKFDKDDLAVGQKNYLPKIVNACTAYDLEICLKIPLHNLKLKYSYFDATNTAKTIVEEKWMNIGNGIAFDGKGSWNVDNNFAKNVVIFGVDNSSSSHAYTCRNNFWVLDEGTTYGIN